LRQGAASVRQLEITPQRPDERTAENPWPEYPMTNSTGYGQAEAAYVQKEALTMYSTSTTSFIGAERGQLIGIETTKVDQKFQPVAGTETTLKADLVLLAMGFTGPERSLLDQFDVNEILDDYATNNERVYVAGDAKRGPSLVIWAIREGRLAAEKVDAKLRALVKQ
jgi:glutamate synthase (NADPH/NADH) small chain